MDLLSNDKDVLCCIEGEFECLDSFFKNSPNSSFPFFSYINSKHSCDSLEDISYADYNFCFFLLHHVEPNSNNSVLYLLLKPFLRAYCYKPLLDTNYQYLLHHILNSVIKSYEI